MAVGASGLISGDEVSNGHQREGQLK